MSKTTSKRASSVIYPVVSPGEWAKRYNLSVSSHRCVNCGHVMHPTIPFAYGRWRGLMAAPHGCDEGYDMLVATKATVAERQDWVDFFNVVSSRLTSDPR